jgi:hypothetical protein
MDFVKVKAPLTLRFIDVTTDYGRAEFVVCVGYWRGKIRHIYISRAQQHSDSSYDVELATSHSSLSISSYGSLDNAKVWLFGHCEVHKATFMRLYVPLGSSELLVDWSGLSFRRGDANA